MRPPSSLVLRPVRLATLAAAALFALATAAHAAVTVTVNGAAGPYLFGQSACTAGTAVSFAYDFSASTFASSSPTIVLRATSHSDCTANSDKDIVYSPANQEATGNVSVKLSDFIFGTDTCTTDKSTSANPGIAYFCVVLENGSTVEDSGNIVLNYAMTAPQAPINLAVASGDAQLHVSWALQDASSSIATYNLYCEPDGTAFEVSKIAATINSGTTATVNKTGIAGTALANDTLYDVSISVTDTYGNTSPLATAVTGTPEPVEDFYEYYVGAGGSARGGHGCQSAEGTAWLGVLGALLFSVRVGRRRSRLLPALGLSTLALLLALPAPARAESGYDDLALSSNQRPERRLFVAVEFDKYTPGIDSEKDLNGKTPYHDIFGKRVPWRGQLEVALEVWHPHSLFSLLFGGSAGFWQNIGKGIYASGPNVGQTSNDTTLLDIFPFGVEATLRLDAFANRWRWFPLIPYAKAGLNASLWTIYSGNGKVARTSSPEGRGSGWTTGYTTAAGVAIALDAIDQGVSNEAFIDLGLQRTSIFAEYGWTRLDAFRRGGVLILSDRGPRIGLSLEF